MPNEPNQADRDAARLLMQWCEATGVNEDMLADHFRMHRLSTEAAIVAWQPIETAPKDGAIWVATEYSGHASGFMEPVRRFRSKWQNIYEHGFIEFEPTYWRPLPTPPIKHGMSHD